MPSTPQPASEAERLKALHSYRVLDSPVEPAFDNLTAIAAKVCNAKMAVLTFLDERRQWFKSRLGISVAETAREIAFCAHTVARGDFFEVRDAFADPSFRENPLVTDDPKIRFYAGVPLKTSDGRSIGSLAVLDNEPGGLSPEQKAILFQLADHAMLLLDLRRRGWRSSELSRVICEASPLPIVVVDKNARVEVWNNAAEKVFGWKSDEVTGKDYPLVPDSAQAQYRELLQDVIAGNPARLDQAVRRTRDGSEIRVNAFWAPLRDERGEVCGAMAILEDVTAQLESEAKLRHSLSLLSATLESTADGILVVDREGKIVAHNQRFTEIWKLPDDVLRTGIDADALKYAQNQMRDPEMFVKHVNELYDNPEADSFDRLELKDGRIIERYSQCQRVGKEVVGRVWSFRDITDRVTLEEHLRQSQKMEAVGALAGGVAHDFNNLLNIMIGYNALLSSELPPSSHLAEYADKIRHAADRAAALTRQLLAFSRRQVMRPEVLNVNELISSLSQMLPRLLPENIELHLDLDPAPLFVNADPGQLEQVLINLAVNARDAMPRGGELRISTVRRQEQQHGGAYSHAEISVADTGTGIDPEVMPRIFEPFFTTKPIGRGTGLGLSTVYGIIRQSNGTIHVKSDEGRGATFVIRLPIARQPQIEQSESKAPRLVTSDHNAQILVVEDDLGLRTLIAHILRDAGYQVIEAPSPENALETVADTHSRIDLLVTDVMMPRMNGAELAERAVKLRPNLKVAFMTGYAEEDLQIRCASAAVLEKPFSPQDLLNHVNSVLTRSESKRHDDVA